MWTKKTALEKASNGILAHVVWVGDELLVAAREPDLPNEVTISSSTVGTILFVNGGKPAPDRLLARCGRGEMVVLFEGERILSQFLSVRPPEESRGTTSGTSSPETGVFA